MMTMHLKERDGPGPVPRARLPRAGKSFFPVSRFHVSMDMLALWTRIKVAIAIPHSDFFLIRSYPGYTWVDTHGQRCPLHFFHAPLYENKSP